MCLCRENNWCRDWHETQGGKYPASEHAPGCDEYKTERFVRVGLYGSWCLMEPDAAIVMMDEVKYNDDAEDYIYEEVYLTRDQYEALPEFEGF